MTEDGLPVRPGVGVLAGRAQQVRLDFGHERLAVEHWLFALLERHARMVEDLGLSIDMHMLRQQLRDQLGRGRIGRPLSVEEVIARAGDGAHGLIGDRDVAAAIIDAAGLRAAVPVGKPVPETPDIPSSGATRPRAESGMADPFAAALACEAADPVRADHLYRRALDENEKTSPLLFAAAVFTPVLASLIAFYAAPALPLDRNWTTAAIILVGGYLPPALLYGRRVIAAGNFDDVSDLNFFMSSLAIALMFMFEGVLFVLAVAIAYLIVGVPVFALLATGFWLTTGTPWLEPPAAVANTVGVILLAGVIIVTLSDVHPRILLRPRQALSEIVAGLRFKGRDILQLAAGFGMGAVVAGAGPLELLFDRLELALLAAAASGLLLGLATMRIEVDSEWAIVVGLGRIRCDMRLERIGAGRWRLSHLDEYPDRIQTEAGGYLIGCLSWMLREPPSREGFEKLARTLDEAERVARSRPRHRQAWLASVGATRALAGERQQRWPAAESAADVRHLDLGQLDGLRRADL